MLCPVVIGKTIKDEPIYCPGHMDVLDGVSGHGVHISIVRCNTCGLKGTENGVFTNGKVERAFHRMKAAVMSVWRAERSKVLERNVTAPRFKPTRTH